MDKKPNQNEAPKKSEPTLMTQREAVFMEVSRVIREEKIQVAAKQPLKGLLSEDQLKKVYAGVANGFKAGKVSLKQTDSNKQKLADSKQLELYIMGLVSNWLRRDKRLNGTLDTKF